MECGRVLIDLAACGRWFWGTWRRRLCLCGIALSEGGGGFEVPLVVLLRVDCILSWHVVLFVRPFSGQVQSGVGAFFVLWRYEWKQPWFVRSCVRKCFDQTGRDILWKMEGISGLVWVCFWRQVGRTSRESLYVATRLRFCPEVKYQGC